MCAPSVAEHLADEEHGDAPGNVRAAGNDGGGADAIGALTVSAFSKLGDNRGYVIPNDVNEMYEAIVAHRIALSPEAKIERLTAAEVLAKLKDAVKAPIVK